MLSLEPVPDEHPYGVKTHRQPEKEIPVAVVLGACFRHDVMLYYTKHRLYLFSSIESVVGKVKSKRASIIAISMFGMVKT